MAGPRSTSFRTTSGGGGRQLPDGRRVAITAPMHTIFFDFGNVIAYFDHRVAVRHVRPKSDLDEDAIFAAVYNTDLEDAFEAGRMGGEEFVRRACEVIGYRGTPDEFR